jgi:hypothetical protein
MRGERIDVHYPVVCPLGNRAKFVIAFHRYRILRQVQLDPRFLQVNFGIVSRLDNDRSLRNPIQLIIQLSSHNSTLYCLRYPQNERQKVLCSIL